MGWLDKVKNFTNRIPKVKKDDVNVVPTVSTATVKKPDQKSEVEKPKSKITTAPVEKKSKKISSRPARWLMRPIISEKAAHLAEIGQYIFEVRLDANKVEIKKAIQELYGVDPINVSVMNVRGKQVRWGRYYGKRKNWKRVIVSLKKGQRLDIYEGV